jgi:tetratricopeptide (TPR) repeat protein
MGDGVKSLEKSSRVLTRFPKNRFFNEKSLYEEVRAARSRSHRMKQGVFIKVFYVYQKKRNIFAKLLQESLAYFENGQYDLAVSEAKKALTTHSFVEKIYNLHLFLASCHLNNKEHQKAINELGKAEKIDPFDEKINFYLACCYKSIRQTDRYQEELDNGLGKLSVLFHIRKNFFVKHEGRVGWLKKVS